MHQLGFVRLVLRLAVKQLVRNLLESLVAEKGAAYHEQRSHRPRRQSADNEGRRHQDGLVDGGSLGHRPHDRQLAVGTDAGYLLGVERQVVAQHACGLPRGDLGEQRHVVESRGDIVEQGEQAGWHGRS